MSENAPAVGPGTERDYVGFGRRTLAFLIDSLVWLTLPSYLLLDVAFGVLAEDSPAAAAVVAFVYFSLWFNYFAFCEWRWGQTIGKNATGIIVTGVDGGKPSFGQASVRGLLRLVDFFVIGWVMIAAGGRHQRLGDKAAKTVVVRRPPRRLPAATAAVAAAASRGEQPPAPAPHPAAPGPPPPPSGPTTAAPAIVPPPGAKPAAAPAGPRGALPAIGWSLADTGWGLLAGLFLAFLVAPALVLPFDPEFEEDTTLLVAQGLLGVSLLGVAVGAASRWRFTPLRETLASLGLRRFAPSALGWMLLALFVYYLAAALFASFVLQPEQEDIGGELGVGDENLLIAIAAVVLIAGLAPIAEELFFRGFLFSGLRGRLSLWPAAVIAGLLFGGIHAVTGITTVIPLTALGIALCWLYEKTGSLWPCVIAHAFNNGLALALIS